MEPFILALIAHGFIGATDVVVNHELATHLPAQPGYVAEQRLHSARELIFATLFGGLAWFSWHGAAALFIGTLLAAELVISAWDTVIELDLRRLPVAERILHVLLFINFGVLLALLVPRLASWSAQPTALVPASHGAASWVLTALAAGALAWSVRDGLSALRHLRHRRHVKHRGASAQR